MPSDLHRDAPDAMQGYVALIGAILRQALADTRLSIRHGKQGHTHPTYADHEDARALLLSRERLTFFCELVGAEVTQVQPALLTAARLPSPMPRGSPVAPRTAHALATPAGHVQTEAQPQVAAERATLDRTGRQLVVMAHPDRWPDTPLAHERTVALVALRATLRPGTTGVPSTGR